MYRLKFIFFIPFILLFTVCQNNNKEQQLKQFNQGAEEDQAPSQSLETEHTIKISSPAFKHGEAIPKKYACDQQDISPKIKWSNLPEGTKSITLLMEDPDAPKVHWVHWLLYNLPPEANHLPQNTTPENIPYKKAKHGNNNFRQLKYGGPCPPKGDGSHRYRFKIFALDTVLDLEKGANIKKVLEVMKGHVIGKGQLIGTFERG